MPYLDIQKIKKEHPEITDAQIQEFAKQNKLDMNDPNNPAPVVADTAAPAAPVPQQTPGILDTVAESLLQGGKKYLGHVAEAGHQIKNQLTPEYRDISKKLDKGTATVQEAQKYDEMSKPVFMSEDTAKKYSNPIDATKETLRATAGGAQYPLMFMSGVPAFAAASAAGKAAEDNSTAKDITKAGILGGIFGFANKIGGNVLSKLFPSASKAALTAAEEAATKTEGAAATTAAKKAEAVLAPEAQTATSNLAEEAATMSPKKLSARSKQFLGQFEIPRKIAEREKPWKSIPILTEEYGIKPAELGDLQEVVDKVTGDTGALTKSVRKAVGGIKGEVDTGGAFEAAQAAFKDSIDLTAADKKQLQGIITDSIRTGKTPSQSNPLDLLDSIKKLEKRGYEFNSKSTSMSPNNRYEEMGRALLDSAAALKENLYKSVSEQGTVTAIKDEAIRKELAAISPKLAEKYWNTTTVEGLRSLQKPFVDLGKMIDYTHAAQNTAFTRASEKAGGNIVTQLTSVVNPALEPVLDVAKSGVKGFMRPVSRGAAEVADAVASKVGTGAESTGTNGAMQFAKNAKMFADKKIINPIGDVVEKVGPKVAQAANVSSTLLNNSLPTSGTPAATPGAPSDQTTAPDSADTGDETVTIKNGATGETKTVKKSELGQYGLDAEGKPTAPGLPSQEQIIQAMTQDMQTTGGKNMAKLSALLNAVQSTNKTKDTKPLSGPNAVNLNKAQTAIRSLDRIGDIMDKSMNLGVSNSATNKIAQKLHPQDAIKLNSDIVSAIDLLGFFRTGASITPAQRLDYVDQFPNERDSKKTAQEKIQRLKEEFAGYEEGLKNTAGSDPQIQFNDGSNPF